MENKFLELEQKCRNGFTKYELNLLLDENTPQIGKSGYFGDYFLITYHAKQAIVYVDDRDAKVHLMTPFYDAIFYHKRDWDADERFSRGDKTIIIRDNNEYNIISKKSKGKPLCNVWFKAIEDKTYFDEVIQTSYYNAISSNGDYVRLSTNGAVLSTEFLEELENCKAMSETDILNKWIKQNRLVVGDVGFVYRGGRTNIIPKDKAIEMFTKYQRDKCYYESDWIIFNGEIALSLREYTETDMM